MGREDEEKHLRDVVVSLEVVKVGVPPEDGEDEAGELGFLEGASGFGGVGGVVGEGAVDV